MALNSLLCNDVPLSNYSLTHSRPISDAVVSKTWAAADFLDHPVVRRARFISGGRTPQRASHLYARDDRVEQTDRRTDAAAIAIATRGRPRHNASAKTRVTTAYRANSIAAHVKPRRRMQLKMECVARVRFYGTLGKLQSKPSLLR